jgi:rhodanese-related sulfurtransferase
MSTTYAPPEKKAKIEEDQPELVDVRTQQDELDELNEKAR